MGRLRSLMLLPAFVLLSAQAVVLRAEEPPGSLRFDLKAPHKPPVVHFVPAPSVVQEDAEAATREIEAHRRNDELMRETAPSPGRRPDLHHDVVNGIQSMQIDHALRRR